MPDTDSGRPCTPQDAQLPPRPLRSPGTPQSPERFLFGQPVSVVWKATLRGLLRVKSDPRSLSLTKGQIRHITGKRRA